MRSATAALATKELLQLLRGRQFFFFLLAELALALATFLLAAKEWQKQSQSAASLAETNRQRLADLTDWQEVGTAGILVAPPVPAGRFLVSPQTWPAFLVSVPKLPSPMGFWGEEQGPAPARVLLFFYSLFALLLSFDAVGAEKAQRTLGLLLWAAGSRRRLLQVKFAVRALAVVAAVWVSLLGATLGVSLGAPEFVREPSFFPTFFALALFLGALCLVFVALGFFISCLFPEPLPALLAGVGAWVLLVVVLPGLSLGLARTLVPPPSRLLLEAQAAAAVTHNQQKYAQAILEPMRRWLEKGPELQSWYEEETARLRRELRAELEKELLAYFASFLRQEMASLRAQAWASGLFPTALYQDGLEHWAGSHRENFLQYVQAVTEYGQMLAQEVLRRQKSIQFVLPFEKDPYRIGRPQPELIPRFAFVPQRANLFSLLPRLTGLVLWALGFFALATIYFRKVDPR